MAYTSTLDGLSYKEVEKILNKYTLEEIKQLEKEGYFDKKTK